MTGKQKQKPTPYNSIPREAVSKWRWTKDFFQTDKGGVGSLPVFDRQKKNDNSLSFGGMKSKRNSKYVGKY